MAHDDVLETVEGRCPRCGAERQADQEYCVECGLRLPPTRGAIPALRRRWVRRLGWYPGDWIWVSLLTLLVAIAGAALAIAFSNDTSSAAGTTVVSPSPTTSETTTSALPTTPTPTTTRAVPTTTRPSSPPGRTQWPASRNGWTVVLFSYPVTSGSAAPGATAARAARAGLPEVGVLNSADYSSLHPGYYVVFSGVYSTPAEAEAGLRSAHAAGFASAYSRQITR